MSIEINHLIVPASDKVASARFLADVLGVEVSPSMAHFEPVQVGTVTLDYDDADPADIRSMHIAFVVDDATFDRAAALFEERGVATFADPGRSQPGQINHRFGGRGVYFLDPDGHFFELMTRLP